MGCEICSTDGEEKVDGVTISAESDAKGWYILITLSTPIMGWNDIRLGYEQDEHSAKAKVTLLASLLREVRP